MKWNIRHRTEFTYATPVKNSFNEVRLQPFSNSEQKVESFLLRVLPATRLSHYNDFYSNVVHHFDILEPHSSLVVESELVVSAHPPVALAPDATVWPLARIGQGLTEARCYDFLGASRFVDVEPATWRLAMEAADGREDTWQVALAVMAFVHGHLQYLSNSTSVHTHIRDVLRERQGVCQDFAHVMLGMCRTLNIPALYVSGYLATEAASATHAWTEVYLPGLGWRGLDPTHNCQTDSQYVKIAVGRDYADVAPVTGTYVGTTGRKLAVSVRIEKAG